jgi:hypothetical protein
MVGFTTIPAWHIRFTIYIIIMRIPSSIMFLTIKSLFRIDYLNIRGLNGKIQEVNKHLEEKSPDVFCLVETFLKTDNKPRDLHAKYRWIGKCRKLSKDKGGIGICINDKVTVFDVN